MGVLEQEYPYCTTLEGPFSRGRFTEIAFRKNIISYGGTIMQKIKTFTTPFKVFQIMEELQTLDAVVNQFIKENNVAKVISVSDAPTTDDTGATIGLIRVVAYEE
jgi:hypothetical protein